MVIALFVATIAIAACPVDSDDGRWVLDVQLAIKTPGGTAFVPVPTDTVLEPGSQALFHVRSNRRGYLSLLTCDPAQLVDGDTWACLGPVTQLWPEDTQVIAPVAPGAETTLPAVGRPMNISATDGEDVVFFRLSQDPGRRRDGSTALRFRRVSIAAGATACLSAESGRPGEIATVAMPLRHVIRR